MRSAPPGHCTNCHVEFEPTETARELCAPCARAYVMGMQRVDGGDAYRSFRRGFEIGLESGAEMENDRLRSLFLGREEQGFATYADVVSALWPDQ